MSYNRLSFEVKDEILFIGFGANETKSMTTLSKDTLIELEKAIGEAENLTKKKSIKGVIFFSHKPGVFLAGVDISLIASLNSELESTQGAEQGQLLYNRIEDLKVPTMALVDGICMGGGLELSLACDKILASNSPKTILALPEVKLGVLPGFGGTYRLPPRVGLPTALDMILSGKNIRAKKAKKIGLVDEVMPAERLLILGPTMLGKRKAKSSSFQEKAADNFVAKKIIFQKARENVLKLTKGHYPAPLRILDTMESGSSKNREAYLQLEAKAFGELSQTEQSKNLQHIFFLTDASKKRPGEKSQKSVKRGAVLGAGTMGGGIAWLFANSGQAPIMKDLNQDALELGLKQASSNFKSALKRRRITKDEMDRMMYSITPTTSSAGMKRVDLLIEAIVEDMNIKKSVFSDIEKDLSDDCLITSNTSSLSVEEMAKAFKKPERFAGLHFFNPVHKMPLVEIITHNGTSEDTINALYDWVLKVKKTPVIVKDGPGFLVNRILMPFINESVYLLAEGVSPKALDQAVLNFGMPMGPCRLMDEIGIDVLVKVGKIMEDGLGARAKACPLSKEVTEAGFLGRKNQKGFYLYGDNGKSEGLNPGMEKILPTETKEMEETEIQMRVFLPMINEAANILDDGIVKDAGTVDLGMIYGTGFPPFRGGLLRYADGEGLDRILESIEKFEASVDKDRYAPAPYLRKLVEEKRKFYDN